MNTTTKESVIDEVSRIMLAFADDTGLSSSDKPPRRYLWTDAHAVCNFLSLYQHTARDEYRQLALALIDQVHSVLGKHRHDDPRSGWISGLGEQEGAQHPTVGGLRIGKTLPERKPGEPYDERIEWDRDGQYFHYLTKWMHALCRAAESCDDPHFVRWAMELAKTVHARFAVESALDRHMSFIWKMSIDLTRPLVLSSSLHDSLDAYLSYMEIAYRMTIAAEIGKQAVLDAEVSAAAGMVSGQRWYSNDPLGIGGLLFDANRSLQLLAAGQTLRPDVVPALLQGVRMSLLDYRERSALGQAANYRLAFRELGLSIGLQAVSKMHAVLLNAPGAFDSAVKGEVGRLEDFKKMAGVITDFWSDPDNRHSNSWLEHQDINSVMLATSLLPGEFLEV